MKRRNVTRAAAAWLLAAAACATAHAQQKPAPGYTQRVQGTIQADAGKGSVTLTSHANTLPDNLGQQVAANLQTAKGKAVAQGEKAANAQAFADSFAGKTVYTSVIRQMPHFDDYFMALDARAASGPRVVLNLDLDPKTLALKRANVTYYPDSNDLYNNFRTDKKTPASVQIDKFELVGDKVYAVSGSFSASDLKPPRSAKKLQGQALPAIRGRFDFAEVPLSGK